MSKFYVYLRGCCDSPDPYIEVEAGSKVEAQRVAVAVLTEVQHEAIGEEESPEGDFLSREGVVFKNGTVSCQGCIEDGVTPEDVDHYLTDQTSSAEDVVCDACGGLILSAWDPSEEVS